MKNKKDLSDFILLEGMVHKSDNRQYGYPDLLIDSHRLKKDVEVMEIAKNLDLDLTSYSVESNGHMYLDNLHPQIFYDLLESTHSFMAPPRIYFDFLDLLKSGINKRKKVYDGNGSRIPFDKLEGVLDEILMPRDPWRAELLDAKYFKANGNLFVRYHKIEDDGYLKKVTEKIEDSIFMKDQKIDLKSMNIQGLPTARGTDISYFHPRNNRITLFSADIGKTLFYCGANSEGSVDGLGVRRIKIKK